MSRSTPMRRTPWKSEHLHVDPVPVTIRRACHGALREACFARVYNKTDWSPADPSHAWNERDTRRLPVTPIRANQIRDELRRNWPARNAATPGVTLAPRDDGRCTRSACLRGKPLSTVTLPRLNEELGIAAVPHGFRSSFRDWVAERTNTPREVIEAALAHTVQNPTEAAYACSDLFERRRRLMNDWAAYLSGAHGQV